MQSDDDLLTFADERESPLTAVAVHTRKILIVDDDEDVHQATTFALQGLEILGHPLIFLHAYSAREAESLLAQEDNIAVILLDVVMESEDAGLRLVEHIRKHMQLTTPRIILRTGQPGYAPELSAIRDYDINDYKTKNELTRTRLYTSVTAAIRSYDQICKLDASRRGLELIVAASGRLVAENGLQAFAAGIITQIAALLGVGAEGLVCAQEQPTDSEGKEGREPIIVVVAAAGRFAGLVQRKLEEIDSERVRGALCRCLSQKTNLIENDAVALFFPARSGNHFAAFIDSPALLSEIDQHLLQVFCSNIAVCAENTRLLARLHDQAYLDRLVRLPTRTAFIEAIDEHIQTGTTAGYTVGLIDIDQFAETNETFGHGYGDAVLRGVAQRLDGALGESCRIARISGDTFGVLGLSWAVRPEKLRPLLSEPLLIDDEVLHQLSISMGFAHLAEVRSGNDAIKNASLAVKLARTEGPGRDAVYTEEIGLETRERTHLLHSLHAAFQHERLFVAYQPQVDAQTGKPLGFEALMRWRDDKGDFIPPDRFIPLAEQSGLINGMGRWIMRSALRTLHRLAEAGWQGLRMAINVSVVQFQAEDFIDSVAAAIRETGVPAARVELEITESVAMANAAEVEVKLQALKALGVTIAIDDFGTGFSSLSYLDRLPIDRLKIDRSFVANIGNGEEGARITEMIIALGHKLNMALIAEGVEDVRQLELLRALGCHEAQGYYFARPMGADDIGKWLHDNS
ncbi:MAG: EAL domain-containing protein [Rhodocyclaceae bacterium]|nr:EAL domain-containing protein [Rhodocyclaceae bacterium]